MKEELEKEILLEKSNLKRIDHRYISHEVEHLLHLDKGIFYTIKELFLRPGVTVRRFLFTDRKDLVKPILFLIITSVFFTIVNNFMHVTVDLFNIDKITPLQNLIRSKEIGIWITKNLGYSQLLMGLFVTIWIRVFFRKYQYNIYELLVLLSYVFGEALLILLSTIILAELSDSSIPVGVGLVIYFTYKIWAIGQFFGEKRFVNYIKSALSYFLGVLTYLVTLILIAFLFKIITT